MPPEHPVMLALAQLAPISLLASEKVKLQDRQDTKYILPASLLPGLLAHCQQDYHVLEIEGVRIQNYESTYYDTPKLNAYLDHHNGHLNRSKIRVRNYVESEVTFFELKSKDNHMRTIKARTQVPFRSQEMPQEGQELLEKNWKHAETALEPALLVDFQRIMLANPDKGERVTIDLDLSFALPGSNALISLPGLCVVEVKRGRKSSPSPIQLALHAQQVLKSSMSKYCVGTALLRPDMKHNRFKPLLLRISRILEKENPGSSILLQHVIHPPIAS